MLNIYICEDNLFLLAAFKRNISEIIQEQKYDMQLILSTPDPQELLKFIEEANNSCLYFLDIKFGENAMSGITLAKEIRMLQPRCFIVFITAHFDMGLIAYQHNIEALDFIIKDSLDEIKLRMQNCMENAKIRQELALAQISSMKELYFKIDIDTDICYSDILYFMGTRNHKVMLRGKEDKFYLRSNLKDIIKKLDDRFIQCHRSYIINSDNIAKLDPKKGEVYMLNNETCKVAANKITVLEQKLYDQLIKRAESNFK